MYESFFAWGALCIVGCFDLPPIKYALSGDEKIDGKEWWWCDGKFDSANDGLMDGFPLMDFFVSAYDGAYDGE